MRAVIESAALGSEPRTPGQRERIVVCRGRSDRVTVRLRPGDGWLLRERAARRAMAPSTYLATLVQAHLRFAPPLPEDEIRLLKAVLRELSVLGRELRLSERGSEASSSELAVCRAIAVLEELRATVVALVRRNAESWAGRDA